MTWGIYFDNSPRRAQVYGNLCIDNTWGGVFIGGGYAEPQDCVVENNVFVNSSVYQLDAVIGKHASGNRFRRNIISYTKPDAALMRAGKAWKDGRRRVPRLAGIRFQPLPPGRAAPLRIADLPGGTYEDWRKLGFEVVSYSGYTREELEADGLAETQRLLDALDLLIDGPFIQDQAQLLLFRGSRNQRIHFLSRRYPRTILDHRPVTEMRLTADGKMTAIGTENPALHRIWGLLEQRGWHAGDASGTANK